MRILFSVFFSDRIFLFSQSELLMYPLTMDHRPLSADTRSRRNGLPDIFSGMSPTDRKQQLELRGHTEVTEVTRNGGCQKEAGGCQREAGRCQNEAGAEILDIVHCPRFRSRRNAVTDPGYTLNSQTQPAV